MELYVNHANPNLESVISLCFEGESLLCFVQNLYGKCECLLGQHVQIDAVFAEVDDSFEPT